MRDVLEVEDTGVIVVLAGEDILRLIAGMDVSNGMLVSVPSSEAQIKTTHKSNSAINQE